MLTHVVMHFNMNTEAAQRADADPRTGGFSEGVWRGEAIGSDSSWLPQLFAARAVCLPKQASLTGFTLALYDFLGNKLIPKGSSTGKVRYPGNSSWHTDIPQMALQMSATAEGKANSSTFAMKCIPDEMVQTGEYTPTTAFKSRVASYCTLLGDSGWGFVGRKLDADAAPVRAVAAGKVNCRDVVGVILNQSYLRFVNVKDSRGDAIKGTFLVTDLVGPLYTLQGLDTAIVAGANGLIRLDVLEFCNFDTVTPDKICVRKIGRPSKGYRGRASRR